MEAEVAWAGDMSQMLFLCTQCIQLYIMPIVLMLVLSAMTIFRREMSCNRVYALEEGSHEESVHRQAPGQSHNSVQTTTATPSSVLSPYVSSLCAPLMWLRFDRGENPDDNDSTPILSSPSGHTANAQTNNNAQRDPLTTAFADFLRMRWTTEDAQQALDTIVSKLPKRAIRRLSEATLRMVPARLHRKTDTSTPLHPENFPADVQVNIMSFLQPKEVVAFACVNRSSRDMVDGNGPTTKAIWKNLWARDYGWLIHSWKIGRQARLRSNICDQDEPHGKEFYFRFGLSYVNYLLAGLNTPDHCFVGLHGNIYDITEFVVRHPGSPETLFVHAGRDATNLFDDMDHSKGARRLAKEFCIAVDLSYEGSCGLRPTVEFEADRAIPPCVEAKPVIGKKERRLRQPECLRKIYDEFVSQRYQLQKELTVKMKEDTNVLHWTLYYDPYQRAWKAWYTSRNFETIFVPSV